MNYLAAFFITIFTIVISKNNKENNKYFYIFVFTISFFIIYLMTNFEIFHKYNPNNRNGKILIDFINKNCIKK